MVIHSKEEVLACTYIHYALFGKCNAECVLEAICLGDQHNLCDMCFRVPCGTSDTRKLFVEYDGSFYHGQDRVSKDIEKTQKLLDANPGSFVIRLRTENAAVFPDVLSKEMEQRCRIISNVPPVTNGKVAAKVANEVYARPPSVSLLRERRLS